MKTVSYFAATLACATVLAVTPVANAQEDATPQPPEESVTSIPTRETAPDTNRCPNKTSPPQAKTTSEAPVDGVTPTPIAPVYDGPCGVIAAEGYQVPDSVLASSWLVADIDTGEVIAMKDPHGRYRPASIIKVLLALTVIDELTMDRKVIVSHESASQDGSAVGIGEGGEYTVEQLLYGLLLASGNDTAHALAQELGGDAATLEKVNSLARELGAEETRAATYSGLDAPGMQTTAWDLAKIYQVAYENPTFVKITNTEHYDFPGYGDLEGYQLWNDNQLFMNDPNGIGGKTGFTDDANHTFVGALDRNGRRIMAIVLDTTVDKARPWEQAQSLIDEAYNFTSTDQVASLNEEAAPVKQDADNIQQTPAPEVPSEAASSTFDSDFSTKVGIGAIAVVALAAIALAALALRSRRASTSSGARPKHRRR
ncbi:D-alanyl-D-alanine carboxypeptidase family protein [Corynebacterium lubricantis]|uniref:D-alanyl-D-alanine carboxypeptidase family protein n=1 Tax=Corynebacterium lubricantis TaxID=541095 RepID=UPI0005274E66|nr:D-alanyl-D-alanine carboxypeptidase family protein [Corynebacterium lubricantis]